jgi:hypothetical protein
MKQVGVDGDAGQGKGNVLVDGVLHHGENGCRGHRGDSVDVAGEGSGLAVKDNILNAGKKQLAASSINVRMCAIRKLAAEAGDNGLLLPEVAAAIGRVPGAPRAGLRLGNWLSVEVQHLVGGQVVRGHGSLCAGGAMG